MTLFTKMRVAPVAFHESDAWLSPSPGAYLSAAGTDAWRDSPVPSMDDTAKLHELQTEAHGIEYDDDGMSAAYSFGASDYLSVEDQTRRITDAGLGGHLKPQQGYSAAMLDVIIDRKRGELERAATREAAPTAWAPLGLAAGLGVSLLDPLNVASAFVPVIGEQRALALLGKAGSAWKRAGARAGIGAVEGAAGAAMVEPVIAAARTQEQAEYGMFEALGNIAFGAAFGAALHPAAGAVGDWLRGRRGQRQPWEFSSPTPDTLALKDAHAQAIYEARFAADPGMDTARLTQEAHAAASLFDARARAWAHDTGRTPEEYYEAYRPQYQAGNGSAVAAPDELYHAMYRNRASSLQDFIDEVLAGSHQDKKSYMGMGFLEGSDIPELQGAEIILASDQVRHIRNEHPDFSEWERIAEIVAQGEVSALGNNRVTGGPTYAFTLPGNKGRALAVLAGPIQTKDGRRLRVLTAFEGSKKGVKNWIKEKKKKAAIYQSAGEITAYPDRKNGLPSGSDGPLENNITSPDAKGNRTKLPQSGTPRASVSFDADGRAVVDFFASADFSSAPHELYHVFRREMEQTAGMADVPARVRENWNRILEFVGAESGQQWTRGMEEKFARAGERFLLEGKAPTPELRGVFEKMRQWFLEIFADADASGLEISDSMRRVFGDMLTTPMEYGDANFRYALGSLLERTFAEDVDTRLPEQPDMDKMPLEAVRALADEEMRNLDAHWQQMSQAHPEAAKIIGDDYRAEVLAAEAEEAAAIRNREILDAIVDCELRRGTR